MESNIMNRKLDVFIFEFNANLKNDAMKSDLYDKIFIKMINEGLKIISLDYGVIASIS